MPTLTLSQANTLLDAVIATARRMQLPPVAAAVLDSGGHLKALQREDGVAFLRVQVCQAKAWGALGLEQDSRDIAARYADSDQQRGFVNALNAMTGGGLIPLPGGLLIRSDSGEILGAVGVAGAASDDDEACARAGLRAIGLAAD